MDASRLGQLNGTNLVQSQYFRAGIAFVYYMRVFRRKGPHIATLNGTTQARGLVFRKLCILFRDTLPGVLTINIKRYRFRRLQTT